MLLSDMLPSKAMKLFEALICFCFTDACGEDLSTTAVDCGAATTGT